MNLTEEQLNKLKELKEEAPFLLKDEALALYYKLEEIAEHLKVIAQKEMPEMPKMEMPDTHKVEIAGAELITIKGEKGDSPTDEHLTELITPLIPEPVVGPRGERGEKGESIIGPPGRDGIDGESIVGPMGPAGKDGSSDTPEQIVEKLSSLKDEARLDKSAIKGLEEVEKDITALKARPLGRMGGGKKITYIKRHNLSSQCDGVTKTFTLPTDTIEVVGVWGTQFPINFNPGTDWTFAGRTLTLTGEVSAPQTGQTLYCLIETLFYG